MRKITHLLIISILTILVSCSKDEDRNTIPAAAVNFNIDFRKTPDTNLRNPGHIEMYTSPRLGTDRMGFSGLLIVSSPTPVSGSIFQLYAYDLCCPFEKRREVKVQPQADGKVKCPQCGSIFNVINGDGTIGIGYPESGPAKDNLQVYIARYSNTEEGIFNINRIN